MQAYIFTICQSTQGQQGWILPEYAGSAGLDFARVRRVSRAESTQGQQGWILPEYAGSAAQNFPKCGDHDCMVLLTAQTRHSD